MNASTPSVNALVFSPGILATENDLLVRYLGSDLHEACDSAMRSGDAALIASAALDLEKRRAAVIDWRKRALVRERNTLGSGFHPFFDIDPQKLARISAGEVPLAELDAEIHQWWRARQAADMDRKTYWKDRLRESVERIVSEAHGVPVVFAGFPIPRFGVISADGSSGFFQTRDAAIGFGRARQVRFLLMRISTPESGVHYPDRPEPDAADADEFLHSRNFG